MDPKDLRIARRVVARYREELDPEAGDEWLADLEDDFQKSFPDALLRIMDRKDTLRNDVLTWRWQTEGRSAPADITVDLMIHGGRRPYIAVEYEFANDDEYDTDNEDFPIGGGMEGPSTMDAARFFRGFFRDMARVAQKYVPA